MANKKAIAIVLSIALAILLGVLLVVVFGFVRFARHNRETIQARDQRLAAVEQYVDTISEKRNGNPPEFLYSVEYRILKQPYPTVSKMESAIGKADSKKESHDGIQLEWHGAPSSDDLLLRADFDSDQSLKKLDYHYKQEVIGRWPSDWQKEIPITIGSPR
jgi:hypothetical protein